MLGKILKMKNIKLTLEFDGTNYHGWQSQNNSIAVQDVVSKAILNLTGENATLNGSSRTDAGVHSYGLSANFFTNSSIPPERFAYALNSALPSDVVVIKSEEVSLDFHARFDSKGKKYRYMIFNSAFPSALLRDRACHEVRHLDESKMQEAALKFLGTHDFSSFMAAGSVVKSALRTIYSADVKREGKIIYFEVKGNGFLYNMVRIMAGTLIEVGYGRIKVADVDNILLSKDRKRAGKTAPAHGLYLVEVYY
jgi:tRNA pseudouridine38-40 synthase